MKYLKGNKIMTKSR